MAEIYSLSENFKFLYVTTKSPEEAQEIATKVINEKLATCANIFPPVISLYKWENNITSASECVMILKTTPLLVRKLADAVGKYSSYEAPCVAAIDVSSMNFNYNKWMKESLK